MEEVVVVAAAVGADQLRLHAEGLAGGFKSAHDELVFIHQIRAAERFVFKVHRRAELLRALLDGLAHDGQLCAGACIVKGAHLAGDDAGFGHDVIGAAAGDRADVDGGIAHPAAPDFAHRAGCGLNGVDAVFRREGGVCRAAMEGRFIGKNGGGLHRRAADAPGQVENIGFFRAQGCKIIALNARAVGLLRRVEQHLDGAVLCAGFLHRAQRLQNGGHAG